MSVSSCHWWPIATNWHVNVTMSSMIYSYHMRVTTSPIVYSHQCDWRSTATTWHVSVTNILQVTVTSVTQDTNESTLWQLDIHWSAVGIGKKRDMSVHLKFDDNLIPTTRENYIYVTNQWQEKSCATDFASEMYTGVTGV